MDNFSSFALSLDKINKGIDRVKSEKTTEYGIRIAHFNCLVHIDQVIDGLTPTEISRVCSVDKAFVSRITSDLIKGDFIQTNKKFDDGRKYRNKYILTERGKAVIKETKDAIDKLFSEIGEKISEYEKKCFFKVFMAVGEIINKN